ncbi:MAG TPA: cyclase family protein [Candidatus Babeliales bacterium]|nr:cyclase family protein [Candidatus Babeliales bacterium]
MKLYDISWPITPDVTEYKDKKTVALEQVKTFERDNVRESIIHLGSHTGTHIDAPSHFLKDGATIDQMPFTATIGFCRVLDLQTVLDVITRADLERFEIQADDIVLCKTANSMHDCTQPFASQFIYLDGSAAEYLVSKKVKAVGIDYLGIERNQPNHETHMVLMQHDIAVIEGLRLGHVPAGSFFLWCVPLAVVGLEAAPARAILIEE